LSWLRLPDFDASDPELVHDVAGNLVEVLVPVRPIKEMYPFCCLAPKRVKNGTKKVRYRDRRLEPAPTWLVVQRQRVTCKTCDATLYQEVPQSHSPVPSQSGQSSPSMTSPSPPQF
jgi:hypothetical protein